jgi:uncharacterized membrane protein
MLRERSPFAHPHMGAMIGYLGWSAITLRCDRLLVATLLLLTNACERETAADVGAGGAEAQNETVSSAGADSGALGWCDVEPLLQSKCQRCHTDPPSHGAPFSLVSYADTQVLDKQGNSRATHMRDMIAQGTMPATFVKLTPPVEPLSDDERTTLLAWLDAGAPLGDDSACR